MEYWVCYECEKVWTDAALTALSNIKNVVLPALETEADHVAAVAATCVATGNIEYWHCEDCGQYWQDEALTQLTNAKNVITPIDETAHKWGEWKTTKESTCYAEGQKTRTCELDSKHTETATIEKIDHVDKDKDDECDVKECKADLSNSKTGDMIMIAVVVMLLAAAAIVVLLTKKRRAA